MGTKEMSDLFDVLYNNITSNQAPGLNEYEKSVFLTKAQDELVKNYFLPQSNPKQAGFDSNQKRQIDFSMLMATGEGVMQPQTLGTVDPRALVFLLPNDIMYIINEVLQYYAEEGYKIKAVRQVVPLKYDDYTRLMSKPFKEPLKYQAWRLMTATNDKKSKVDIVITSSDKSKYITEVEGEGVKYLIRYVKQPDPIILVNLADTFGEDLKIHDKQTQTPCSLDPGIHEEIVQRAVELAKIAWAGTQEELAATQLNMTSGQRSE